MDTKDAHKIIEILQTKPYICFENTIELDDGYVIVKREYLNECREARERQRAKKPNGRYKTRHMWDVAYCPTCRCGITARWNFCQGCGQAINWSEID